MELTCGYEDLLNHDRLRADPMWSVLAGKANPGDEPPAGKSTLNRLEVSIAKATDSSDRYHKIDLDEQSFQRLFTRWYISSHPTKSAEADYAGPGCHR